LEGELELRLDGACASGEVGSGLELAVVFVLINS